ncbi:MAG: TIGR03617 family F420-dependent LLM class oxidoreductase [Pseudomonadota bacterium]
MKVDGHLTGDWKAIPDHIKYLEDLGYDRAGVAEMAHDPFLPLMIAAEHSSKIELNTGIAVAFGRNPMNLANLGHDVNAYSEGRLTMGLGSQIRAHITKRFSMPWGSPAAQMRELVLAVRAIWANWYDKEPLQFKGEYYTHTLMTPAFSPQDTQFGKARITLAAVGPLMTEVAAEVADGLIIHPFSNEKYIREVTMPAIERGLAKSGRSREDLEISYSPFIMSGKDEATQQEMKDAIKGRISFYGSTPAYRNVLAVHGWGELQPQLNAMSKQGQWEEMKGLVTEEMLEVFGIVEEPGNVASALKSRFGDVIDRTSADFGFVEDQERAEMISEIRAA